MLETVLLKGDLVQISVLDGKDFLTTCTICAMRASSSAWSSRGEHTWDSCDIDVLESTIGIVMSVVTKWKCSRRETSARVFALDLPCLLPNEAKV